MGFEPTGKFPASYFAKRAIFNFKLVLTVIYWNVFNIVANGLGLVSKTTNHYEIFL